MITLSWIKRTREAQHAAAIEQAVTEQVKRQPSEAVRQAQRVIKHAEVNGWTNIARELFAS